MGVCNTTTLDEDRLDMVKEFGARAPTVGLGPVRVPVRDGVVDAIVVLEMVGFRDLDPESEIDTADAEDGWRGREG